MSCRKWEIQILRWHEGLLDKVAEARLLRHLARCVHCRRLADKFSVVDGLLVDSQATPLPPFLKEKIVSSVTETMRQDSMSTIFSGPYVFAASFRSVLVGAVFLLGIGLGIATGWDLAKSVTNDCSGTPYDLLSLAGIEGNGSGSSLEFIWTDTNGRSGQ